MLVRGSQDELELLLQTEVREGKGRGTRATSETSIQQRFSLAAGVRSDLPSWKRKVMTRA